MPDEAPTTIQNDSLRAVAAGARAMRGANSGVAPAPPPDEAAYPWAREPVQHTIQKDRQERAARAVEPKLVIEVESSKKKAKKPSPDEVWRQQQRENERRAFEMVDQMLAEWTKNRSKRNLAHANNILSNRMMRNGAVLIKAGYKIDQLASVIRISNELVRATAEDDVDDKKVEELRNAMSRTDITETKPSSGEEEPEDEENGDGE